MQLDSTRIAVRERGLLDIFDLALHVTREFAWPWLAGSLLAILPLAMLNHFLVGWMASSDYETDAPGVRYLFAMTMLIFLEAPLASLLVIAFLGPAVFLEKRTLRQVLADVLKLSPQWLLCVVLLRGVLPAWLIYLAADRFAFNQGTEGFLMAVLVIWAMGLRAFRPFITEIVLLEKNPLRSKNPNVITMGRRSAHLHAPSSSDLFVRWIGGAMIVLLLVALALFTAWTMIGVLASQWIFTIDPEEGLIWNAQWHDLVIVYPACLWLVVAYLSVVHFLSYLDLRIRHEGWEVELLMRAEALRLAAKVG
ncbi:MAG: hypothetical protein SFU86_12275 [Pirellulaceae bacterium]|nr:hypothetical protein [Pirellulaceae bacterium]